MPAENKPAAKNTLAKGHKCRATRTKEIAPYTDSEADDKSLCIAASEEQNKCKQLADDGIQHRTSCKLFTVPQTGLYEHFLEKLKHPAYAVKMKTRLVKCDTEKLSHTFPKKI